ncbi:hypothetical protein JW933_11350 [candidate division FCPU426 bacterium]|nr:hypothetical protein [candidate division FCPU426 bacterium]
MLKSKKDPAAILTLSPHGGRTRRRLLLRRLAVQGVFLISVLIVSWPAQGTPGDQETHAEYLAQNLFQSGRTLHSAQAETPKGRLEDLELFWLAEILDALGQGALADQHRQYLRDFFPSSSLLAHLPSYPEHTPYLQEYNPDPGFSRLIKTAYARIGTQYLQATDSGFEDFVSLVQAQVESTAEAEWRQALGDFVSAHPDSDWAGWAVYELAWIHWLENQGDTEALSDFWRQHQDHPLAQESSAAMDVPYFSPRRLALLSSLVPGLGEETLEPGLHLSSGLWYSEILFLAGAVGFALAAQNDARLENLTGALISANLLFLNHQGSAEKAFVLARRRNWAEKRKFSLERTDLPATGSGHFAVPAYFAPEPESLAHELILSVTYEAVNAGSGFAGKGLVEESQLVNMGFRGEFITSLLDVWHQDRLGFGLAAVPHARFFANHARPQTGQLLDGGLHVQEAAAGADLALLLRWYLGDSRLQFRMSAGPSLRLRNLTVDRQEYTKQDMLGSAALVLNWGGHSGTYWQIGVFYEDSFQDHSLTVAQQSIILPSRSLGYQFGLGIRF